MEQKIREIIYHCDQCLLLLCYYDVPKKNPILMIKTDKN